jgi:hypothetical protein
MKEYCKCYKSRVLSSIPTRVGMGLAAESHFPSVPISFLKRQRRRVLRKARELHDTDSFAEDLSLSSALAAYIFVQAHMTHNRKTANTREVKK